EAEWANSALTGFGVEEIRRTQVVKKAGREQSVDGKLEQERLVDDEIHSETRLRPRQNHRVVDRESIEAHVSDAQPGQRRAIEEERRQVFRGFVQRRSDELDVAPDACVEDQKSGPLRVESTQIEVDLLVGKRPRLFDEGRQLGQLLIARCVGPGGRIIAHPTGNLYGLVQQVRPKRHLAVRNAFDVVLQKIEVRLKVSGIVGERIDGGLESAIE